jgi:small subunit ribosomal protein S8
MDQISNMLIKIKNASRANHDTVVFPYSKLKLSIAECLEKEGFIRNVTKKTEKGLPVIEVELIYTNDEPRIHDVTRVSKSSRRMYMGVKEIKPIKHGRGKVILSTPKGILTDVNAKKEMVGGEILFSIW